MLPPPTGPIPSPLSSYPSDGPVDGYHRVLFEGDYYDCFIVCYRVVRGPWTGWLARGGRGRPVSDTRHSYPKHAKKVANKDAPAPEWAYVVHRQCIRCVREYDSEAAQAREAKRWRHEESPITQMVPAPEKKAAEVVGPPLPGGFPTTEKRLAQQRAAIEVAPPRLPVAVPPMPQPPTRPSE